MSDCKAYTDLMTAFEQCGLTDKQIAKQTNISYFYVRMLRRGDILNPGIRHYETLMTFMAGQIHLNRFQDIAHIKTSAD